MYIPVQFNPSAVILYIPFLGVRANSSEHLLLLFVFKYFLLILLLLLLLLLLYAPCPQTETSFQRSYELETSHIVRYVLRQETVEGTS